MGMEIELETAGDSTSRIPQTIAIVESRTFLRIRQLAGWILS
jgi:hypothetical protein